MISDTMFFAWLDGELSSDEAARVEAAVASDQRLSALAAEHRAVRSRLNAAFDTLLEAPMPHAVSSPIQGRPEAALFDLSAARAQRAERPRWGTPAQWGAMAATLAIGLFLGMNLQRTARAPIEVQGGKIYAASALNGALDTQMASAPSGETRIGLTFRDQGGAVCRTFTDAASSGLACREDGRWRIRGMFAAPERQADEYRMAAGLDPNLAALVDSSLSGEPFNAAEEAASRKKGWK